MKHAASAVLSWLLVSMAACGAPDEPVRRGAAPVLRGPDEGPTWYVLGERIVGKVTAEESGGAYAVVLETSPPGAGPPPHVNSREDELLWVLEGRYEVQVGDRRFETSAGGFAVLPRGIPHAFRNLEETPGTVIATLVPGGFEEFFAEIDALSAEGSPDPENVVSRARKYGLEFLPAQPSK